MFFSKSKKRDLLRFFALLHTFSRTMLLSEFPLQFCNGAGTQKKLLECLYHITKKSDAISLCPSV